MNKKWLKLIGLIFLIKGILLIIILSQGITGFSIAENIQIKTTSIIGIALVIAGLLIMESAREVKQGKLESASQEGNRNLSEEEKKEIKAAFKDWSRKPDKRQKEVLAKYGLYYKQEKGKNHGTIYSTKGDKRISTTSFSPSDYRTGRNKASEIIRYLEGRPK